MTFLSHQAIVLPLKIAAPRWTSGTALVLGSMAPDVEYFLRGYPDSTISHTLLGQVTFCLPVTLALYWVVTRVIAEPAAAHAPAFRDFRLRDYALVRHQTEGVRHWAIVASSALIGSCSHIVLDRGIAAAGGVPYHSVFASRSWVIANLVLWIVLAGITLLLMRHIGRNELLRRWADARRAETDPSRRPGASTRRQQSEPVGSRASESTAGRFWGWVTLGLLVGAGLGAYYRRLGWYLDGHAAWIHIWLCAVSGAFVALLLASAAWHVTRARTVHLRDHAP